MAFARIKLIAKNWQQFHAEVSAAMQAAKPWVVGGHRIRAEFKAETRSSKQNDLMWSCLEDLSDQVTWFGKRLKKEGWKDFITAHLNGQELVPNMDGTGFVALGKGKSTSGMSIAEMTAVIDLAHAFGAQNDVKWRRTSLGKDVPDECFEEAHA